MAYSTDVAKAEELACRVHAGQIDKAGVRYEEHLRRVAASVSNDREKVVAWLHDTVEDAGITIEQIKVMFGLHTAAAVLAMTHNKAEDYFVYVRRIKSNRVARAVKIADLIDNLNLSRILAVRKITSEDAKRVAKYARALNILFDN